MNPDSGRTYILLSIIAMVLWAKFVQSDDLAGQESILNRMFLTASAADEYARAHDKKDPLYVDEFQSNLVKASLHIQSSDRKFWEWLKCATVADKDDALKQSKNLPASHVLYCVVKGASPNSQTHYFVIGKDARGALARFSADEKVAILESTSYCESYKPEDVSSENNRQDRNGLLCSDKRNKHD